MKKWASLSIVSMLLLSACGGNAPTAATDSGKKDSGGTEPKQTAQTTQAASGEKKKLSFWYIETGQRKELIEATVQKFMQQNPDVEVEAVQIPNDAYKTKLSVAMGGGSPPDVFHSWGGGWLKQFVSANQVLDLTGKVNSESYVPAAIGAATFNSKIYGAPLAMSVVPMFYNKEIFAKYQLQPPKTYDELLTIIDKLKKENIIPIAMANKTKWPAAFYLMYFAEKLAGPQIFSEAFERTGRTFDDPAYVKAGEMIQDLVKRGAFNPGFNGLTYDTGQSRQLLYTGKAAMEMQTASYVNNVRNEAPDFEKKLGMFPFPEVSGGKGNISNVVGGVSPVFSVAAKSKYPDKAIELIKMLTSQELAQQFSDKTSAISAVKGVEYKDPFAIQLNEMLSKAGYLQTFYDQTLPPDLAELHKDTTQALFGETMTPAEAAKQMEAKAKEILKK